MFNLYYSCILVGLPILVFAASIKNTDNEVNTPRAANILG